MAVFIPPVECTDVGKERVRSGDSLMKKCSSASWCGSEDWMANRDTLRLNKGNRAFISVVMKTRVCIYYNAVAMSVISMLFSGVLPSYCHDSACPRIFLDDGWGVEQVSFGWGFEHTSKCGDHLTSFTRCVVFSFSLTYELGRLISGFTL